MTKHEKIVVSAFTGTLMCDFNELHAYIEEKLGRPVFTHELADSKLIEEIKRAVKDDFLAICMRDEAHQEALAPVDKIIDLLFELFDQHDISIWREICGDSTLANVWTKLVTSTCIDGQDHDAELKQGLRRYFIEDVCCTQEIYAK